MSNDQRFRGPHRPNDSLLRRIEAIEHVPKPLSLIFLVIINPRADRRATRCTSITRRRVWEPQHLHERRLRERRECAFQRTEDERVARTLRVRLFFTADDAYALDRGDTAKPSLRDLHARFLPFRPHRMPYDLLSTLRFKYDRSLCATKYHF